MNNLHYEYGNIERLHELQIEVSNISHTETHTTNKTNTLMIVCLTSLVAITVILTLYNSSVYAGMGEIEKAITLFKML